MTMFRKQSLPAGRQGFVNFLVLLILALAGLKYFFNWSVLDALETPSGQNTVTYMKEVSVVAWGYAKFLFATLIAKIK